MLTTGDAAASAYLGRPPVEPDLGRVVLKPLRDRAGESPPLLDPSACEPGCSACGFNWYKMNWRAGNPTKFWDGPLGCNCCNTTPPQWVTCRRVCVLTASGPVGHRHWGDEGTEPSPIVAACAPLGDNTSSLAQRDMPIFSRCLHETRRRLPLGAACAAKEMRVSVAFYPAGVALPPLPKVQTGNCSVMLVDEATTTAPSHSIINGWHITAVPLCFRGEAQRSAHWVKTALPMLLPNTQRLLYGDAKCMRVDGTFPATELRSPLLLRGSSDAPEAYDVVAVKNGNHRTWSQRKVRDEIKASVAHLRPRHEPRSTYEDIEVQWHWLYAQQGYNMDLTSAVPDTFCMGYARTAAARVFSCRWSLELALFSMREQNSFDHARQRALRVTWINLTIPGS